MSADRQELTPEELEAEGTAELPDRDPMPLAGAGGPVGGPVAGEVLDALNQPLLERDSES